MDIALIGHGKMGRMVEEIVAAEAKAGYRVVAVISRGQKIEEKALKGAQVCLDFSHPSAVVSNLRQIADLGKDIVVGTTGWYDQIEEVCEIVSKRHTGLIYAPNFSIGVQLFLQMIEYAAQLMDPIEDYDVGVVEEHHKNKADKPSGTALAIANKMLAYMKRKKTICCDLTQHGLKREDLFISSFRCGSIPGAHSVIFDSPVDTITLTHEARNREGFARGALAAAKWIYGKKGLYTLADMLRSD